MLLLLVLSNGTNAITFYSLFCVSLQEELEQSGKVSNADPEAGALLDRRPVHRPGHYRYGQVANFARG